MADNNGLVTELKFSKLQSGAGLHGSLEPQKNSAAAAVRDPSARVCSLPSKARASELGVLDLREPRRRATDRPPDEDRSERMLGYALLAVTFVLGVVLLWPWLGPKLSELFA